MDISHVVSRLDQWYVDRVKSHYHLQHRAEVLSHFFREITLEELTEGFGEDGAKFIVDGIKFRIEKEKQIIEAQHYFYQANDMIPAIQQYWDPLRARVGPTYEHQIMRDMMEPTLKGMNILKLFIDRAVEKSRSSTLQDKDIDALFLDLFKDPLGFSEAKKAWIEFKGLTLSFKNPLPEEIRELGAIFWNYYKNIAMPYITRIVFGDLEKK